MNYRRPQLSVRGDVHVLLVGDPAVGKSQMLRWMEHVAPRYVYVGGQTSSVCGLTASFAHEGRSRFQSGFRSAIGGHSAEPSLDAGCAAC